MLGHVVPQINGNVGVDIFFVLSGYLITLVLFHDAKLSVPIGAFYWRRWLRLFPALVLVCGALVAYSAVVGDTRQATQDVIAALLYVSNWCRAFPSDAASYLGNTWSLAVEEQFYLLWPALFYFALRVGGKGAVRGVALILLAGCVIWRQFLALDGADYARLYNGFDTHCDGLLLGCALATFRPEQFAPKLTAVFAVLGALALLAFVATPPGWTANTASFINIAAALLVLGARDAPDSLLTSGLSVPTLVYVGRISYGLYLWHYPILIALLRLHVPDLERAAIDIPLSFLLAATSYHYIERPALDLRYSAPRAIAKRFGSLLASTSLVGVALGIAYFFAADVQQAIFPQPIAITNYGPRTLRVGEKFNVQPDGRSFMWVQFSHPAPRGSHIVLDGQQLETNVSSSGANAALPDSISSSPGVKSVTITDQAGTLVTPAVTIDVTR